MLDLQRMFHADFTEPNQADLLRVLEAGLRSMENLSPTNLHSDGLAADDVRIQLMQHRKPEFPWLSEVNLEFARFYLEWVQANRKRIDAVLLRS